MSNHYNDATTYQETDLTDIFSLIGRFFKGILHFFFRILEFIIRMWWVFLLLIIAGVALGYTSSINTSYTANLLIKTNFKSQSYVYTAIKQFDKNLAEGDVNFIKNFNRSPKSFTISSVKIDPVVEVLDLISYIGENDRALGEMTREFKVEDDKELFATDRFLSTYKFHKLEITLNSDQQLEDIKALMSFINEQPYAKDLKSKGVESHNELLNSQIKSIEQVNKLIDSYGTEMNVKGSIPDEAFYFNNMSANLSGLFDIKTTLVNNLEEYRNDEVSNKDVAVIVSDIQASKSDSLFNNWILILYPLILVVLFLILAGIWTSFKSYKNEKTRS
ncbi:hypothetical protein [Dokdonia sp. Hel_I_53]|uniref:hypothetical protein n=1 Tax=Dokdonia sp. Hel_I_53 TaxID=1566287 RepID=UPI00119C1398|nr:hypothetical protein [Dokdonia sp. Hel_I_53]TVZ52660.1 hypothetical protein OD90_1842 [Dokdonia sp. Hel_I_53]